MVDSGAGSPGRVLLVGATGLERRLAGAITGGAAAPGSPPAAGGQAALPWRLDTKYYTAEALLEAAHVEAAAPGSTQLEAYEAVVLVFDAGSQPSFAAVQRWYEAAGGPDADVGVRLALGLLPEPGSGGGSGAAPRPAWLDAAEEWCVDQLVELVEAPADQKAAAQPQQPAGAAAASSREGVTGLHRVREALEAHMWPGMQLKPRPRLGSAAAAAAGDAVEPAVPSSQQQAANGAGPPVEDAVPRTNGLHSAAGGGGSTGEALSFAEYLQAPGAGAAEARGGGGGGSGGEEEEDVQQLEQLFAQVASHRAQLAQLPDEQRREAAAAMVMQLMAAMGLEEDDDEEWDQHAAAPAP